jgi:hypothetical protein
MIWIVVQGDTVVCSPAMRLDEHEAHTKVWNERRGGVAMRARPADGSAPGKPHCSICAEWRKEQE